MGAISIFVGDVPTVFHRGLFFAEGGGPMTGQYAHTIDEMCIRDSPTWVYDDINAVFRAWEETP